jgi:uncharacterized protein YndB with AHSA1/START domain
VAAGPLRYRFVVRCPPNRAFALWTGRAAAWWPIATHSVSGHRDAVLVIEPGAGGRLYERTADGREFSWGTVLAWEPPGRLVCEWLVGDIATELEVRFTDDGDGGTVVDIEHRGWEQFGEAAGDRRDHNARGWSGVIPLFVTACAGSAAGTGA